MLELRPNCKCCGKDLPPAVPDAMICTFECTFCRDCVGNRLQGVCPNCGGNFAPRARPQNLLPTRHRRGASSILPAAARGATLAPQIVHELAKIAWRCEGVAQAVLEPLEAAPQHGLIAVDHRLAKFALDRLDRLDLRRIGAA